MHVSKPPLAWFRLAALLAVFTLATGCATYRPVPNEDWSKIESGADLRVSTQLGEVHEFRVTAVEDQKLLGEALELHYKEIAWIERRSYAVATKRLLLVAVGAFVTYTLLDSNFDFEN